MARWRGIRRRVRCFGFLEWWGRSVVGEAADDFGCFGDGVGDPGGAGFAELAVVEFVFWEGPAADEDFHVWQSAVEASAEDDGSGGGIGWHGADADEVGLVGFDALDEFADEVGFAGDFDLHVRGEQEVEGAEGEGVVVAMQGSCKDGDGFGWF